MNNPKTLKIWQTSMEVTTAVYALAHQLPTNERHGLKSQLCKSAVAVTANIANGAARDNIEEFDAYLDEATGFLHELETHLLISLNLAFFAGEETLPLLQKIEVLQKMLYKLRKKLNQIHAF